MALTSWKLRDNKHEKITNREPRPFFKLVKNDNGINRNKKVAPTLNRQANMTSQESWFKHRLALSFTKILCEITFAISQISWDKLHETSVVIQWSVRGGDEIIVKKLELKFRICSHSKRRPVTAVRRYRPRRWSCLSVYLALKSTCSFLQS